MRISDWSSDVCSSDLVKLTLFSWDGITATSYGKHTGSFGGESKLGLLEVFTDEGVVGHPFLGSARNPADMDGPALIQFLKSALLGKNHLDREALNNALFQRARNASNSSIDEAKITMWTLACTSAAVHFHLLHRLFHTPI